MIFDTSTVSDLKPWLIRTLEPICDAEPGALAEYVLALLNHDAPEIELRKELATQLDEFLEKEGPSFIDTLFTVLRTKSYLPYTSTTSPQIPFLPPKSQSLDNGIPIPLDALLSPTLASPPERGRKRSLDHDERDPRDPLPKGPRLNNDSQFSRYSHQNGRHDSNWGGRPDRGSRPMGITNGRRDGQGPMMARNSGMDSTMAGNMNGPMGPVNTNGQPTRMYQPPNGRLGPPDARRGICRDYHNNGYCARGAFCKYSHGDDAVVPGHMFPMGGQAPIAGLPFLPMFPNGVMSFNAGAAYDPHEARMDMRRAPGGGTGGPGAGGARPPHQRVPLAARVKQEDGEDHIMHDANASGELPVIQDLTPQQMAPTIPQTFQPRDGEVDRAMGAPIDSPMTGVIGPLDESIAGRFRGGTQGVRGGGRGTFTGEAHDFRPQRRTDKTLVVEKLPEDKLSLDAVNGWFKRFGTVTNVAIDASTAKALVSFANHEEAHAAWKSQEAVFGNRFVKVFWHRPVEGHGKAGTRMLAASALLVASISKESPVPRGFEPSLVPSSTSTTTTIPGFPKKSSVVPTAAVSALAAKQQLLEKQIAEQKSLMTKLSSASVNEKKDIMARLRKLGDEMKPSSTAATPPPQTSTPTKSRALSTPRSDEQERKERERLDKELELHAAAGAATTGEGGEEGTNNAEGLEAQLAKLKAEAVSLGLSEASSDHGYSYRPYRGRARGGRSYYRGAGARGGVPRGSLKLDNRPKKLLVKGVTVDNLQAVRDWYETTGQVESVEATSGADVIVSFRSRNAAEQGLAKGRSIPTVGQVQISWHNGAPTNGAAIRKASTSSGDAALSSSEAIIEGVTDPHEAQDLHEEEVAASGWGGNDEDGMGML